MASLTQQKPKVKTNTTKDPGDPLARILEVLSPMQQAFLLDESRFKLIRAGRRAGKSFVDVALGFYTAIKMPGSPIGFFGLTRDSTAEALWPSVVKIVDLCKINCTPNKSKLQVDFPNGSSIRLFGADMEGLRDRFRGRAFRLVIVDECAFYAAVDALVTEALLPTIADMQGSIVMTSSPGIVKTGLFYEADLGDQKDEWAHYGPWTMHDNPHFQAPSTRPGCKTLADEEMAVHCKMKFRGDVNNPMFRREYWAEWCFTSESLVYPLALEHRHAVQPMHRPLYDIGVNLSSYGRQSYVVTQYTQYSRTVQVIASGKCKCKNLNELATLLEGLKAKYETDRLVCYLGKEPPEILDDFKQRYSQIPLQASRYEKLPFFQTVIATDMASGFIAVAPQNTDLLNEFDRIVRDADGLEVAGQDTLLADAFFASYLSLYNTHLKAIDPPESEDDRMLRQLIEQSTGQWHDENDY